MTFSDGELPLVTIVITSYNKGPYLAEAIESALCQDYHPDEILVVDDGSTDDTRQVAKSFGDQVRYVYQPNGGPSSAKNRGVRLSQGEFIAFLDGDDRWLPGKLRKQMDVLRRNPEVSVVYTRSAVFDHQSGKRPSSHATRPLHRGHVLDALLKWNFIPFSSSVVRKKCLVDVGMLDETVRYGDDYDLWLRVARTHTFDFVDETLVEYGAGINQSVSRTGDVYQQDIALQRRFVDRFFDGHYPRPSVMRKGTATKYAARGDHFLREGRHLRALLAHSRALWWDPGSFRAYVRPLRDLIPNRCVGNLKSIARSIRW